MAFPLTGAATGGGMSIRMTSRALISKLVKSSVLGSTTYSLRQLKNASAVVQCLCVLSTSRVISASTLLCFRVSSATRAKSTSASVRDGVPSLHSTLVSCRQQAVGTAAIRCGRLRSTSRSMSTSVSVTVVGKTLTSKVKDGEPSLNSTLVLRRQQKIGIAAVQCRCVHSTSTPISTMAPTTIVKKREKQSPKLLMEVFAELELPAIQEIVGGVRVRQHVNPLKASLVAPVAPVKWKAVFADCTLPLMVDIGCGPGRLLMVLGKRSAGTENFLGLDVRWRLVDRANLWADELNLTSNVHFVTANATLAFGSLLATYPGPLVYVFILCPDPHFKRRHQKRRIVQKQLVDAIVHHLKPGGKIFVQSDVEEVAVEMRAEFEEHLGSSLEVADADGGESDVPIKRDAEGWVEESPLGVPSEREAHVVATGGRVYRALYKRI